MELTPAAQLLTAQKLCNTMEAPSTPSNVSTQGEVIPQSPSPGCKQLKDFECLLSSVRSICLRELSQRFRALYPAVALLINTIDQLIAEVQKKGGDQDQHEDLSSEGQHARDNDLCGPSCLFAESTCQVQLLLR